MWCAVQDVWLDSLVECCHDLITYLICGVVAGRGVEFHVVQSWANALLIVDGFHVKGHAHFQCPQPNSPCS